MRIKLIYGVLVTVFGVASAPFTKADSNIDESRPAEYPLSFAQLLEMPVAEIAYYDAARMNLLCAQGLSGAEKLDVRQCLAVLDMWAKHVASDTQRNLHRFRDNPVEGDNSEAKWRMLMLATILQQDMQVRYNPARIETPEASSPNDEFFADSRDVLLHGLLGPRHMGTCSSIPVLYVAIGRRLGYPLKLAATKGHLFVRWQDPNGKEQFNFEGTGQGGKFHTDDYYRHWPLQVTDQEVRVNHYLQPMVPREELAIFLVIRAAVLKSAGRFSEARVAVDRAHKLVPESPGYRDLANAYAQAATGLSHGTLPTAARRPLSTDEIEAFVAESEAVGRYNRQRMAGRMQTK